MSSKKQKAGIEFFNVTTGETRLAETVEHIAAFYNSSDLGPNAKNRQDFGWRLAPDVVVELEEIKNDPDLLARIAQGNQIPIEDLADFNILRYIATRRFREAAQKEQAQDYTNEYEAKLAEERKKRGISEEKPAKNKASDKIEESTN